MGRTTKPRVHDTRQDRSRETLARILQATRELLELQLFEDITVQQIADRAGCSVGAIYGRVRDKEAILPHLLQLYYQEVEPEIQVLTASDRWQGVGLQRRAEWLVDYVVEMARRQRGLVRALVLRNFQHPESIPASIRESAARVLVIVREFLLERADEMLCSDASTAVDIGFLMVMAAIRERIILVDAPQAATLTVSDDAFTQELKQALLAYLTTPPHAQKVTRRNAGKEVSK